MSREPIVNEDWPDRRFFLLAGALALLGATALAALGRFTSALALTLGAAIAIVSALWLSGLVRRLVAPEPGSAARFDWRFGLKAVLRYALTGAALFWAVRSLAAEVVWIVVGLSTVVAAVMVNGAAEYRRLVKRQGA